MENEKIGKIADWTIRDARDKSRGDVNGEEEGFSVVDRQLSSVRRTALKSLQVLKRNKQPSQTKDLKGRKDTRSGSGTPRRMNLAANDGNAPTMKSSTGFVTKRETTSIQVQQKWKKVNEIELKRLENAWFEPENSEVVYVMRVICPGNDDNPIR
jgi:hypothetical protein